MSEAVIRHRGAQRDEDGRVAPSADTTLHAFRIAPAGYSRYTARDREGLTAQETVYFLRPVDLTDADELTVRGNRYQITVKHWISGGFHGMEVTCYRGET